MLPTRRIAPARRRGASAVAGAVLALVLAGCGGGTDGVAASSGTGQSRDGGAGSASATPPSPTGSAGPGASPGASQSGGPLGDGTAGATGAGAPVPWETGRASLPARLPSSPPGRAALTVLLDDGFGVRTTWKLTCDPAGGTHPEPARACGVLGAEGLKALPPTPQDAICTQQYGGPQKARISGTWRGNTISAELSRENGCEIERWTDLLGLLPPAGNVS